ncbi:MAG: class A beta-lactamase [Bacteroidales bacterium]
MRLYLLGIIIQLCCLASIAEERFGFIDVKGATLGLALCEYGSNDIYSINGQGQFPMQSVYKFPIGLAMLDAVDRGVYSLTDSIEITKEWLLEDTWSPIREEFPNGVTMELSELIRYVVGLSDNNGCDMLLNLLGGAGMVNNYLIDLGCTDIVVCNSERELKRDWSLQFDNYTTPVAMIELLKKWIDGELLEEDTNDFMREVMTASAGHNVRSLLTDDIVVWHKSGYSGVGADGVIAANNNVGVLLFPDGRMILFAIFLTDCYLSSVDSYKVIAEIVGLLSKNSDE